MKPCSFLKYLTPLAIGGFFTLPQASGISMLDTANWQALDNTNPYVAEGFLWNAVVFIQWTSRLDGNSYVGTGSLVQSSVAGEYKILTAAHNVDSEGPGNKADGIIDALSFRIYFGANTGADGATATVSVTVPDAKVAVQPLWLAGNPTAGLTKGASQYDLAVLSFSLSGNVTLPTPMQLSTESPVGQVGTMVGYGSWGNGNNFTNNASDGIRRAGRNMIDVVGTTPDDPANQGFTLQSDFDGPNGRGHTTGSNAGLSLESSTAGGDSGGPLIVNGKIVGVLNGGFPGTGGNLSEYGDRSVWASVMDASNQAFLTNAGVVVPEPTSAMLVLGGIGILMLHRRRTRYRSR